VKNTRIILEKKEDNKFVSENVDYFTVPSFLEEDPDGSGLFKIPPILKENPAFSGLYSVPVAYLGSGGTVLSNFENFSVQEDATPIDPSSSFGGVGQITFDTLEDEDSRRLIGNLTLVDGSRGKTSGSVKSISGNNGRLSVVADSILGLFNVDRTVPPYRGTLSGAINYYCDFVGIPNGVTVDSEIASRAVVYPGWKGNVWVGIKQILAKEQVEMALVFDRIHVRPLRKLVAHLDRSTAESFSIEGSNAARSIDISYYNHEYGMQKEVYPPTLDDATIFQVDAGETIVFQERLNASLFSVNQPVVQDWVDDDRYDGTNGVYSVVGNDGLPITAAQWLAQGGSVSVAITDDPSIIEVTVRGANMPDYAPYRIAMSSGSGNYYNSLHITGEAIVMSEETVNIKTGVTNVSSSDEVGVVVKNPFIRTREEAYSLGMIVAGAYAGLNYTVSGTALDLNRGEGSRDVIQATIADFNLAVDSGTTIATFNAEWSGRDIAAFNVYWQEQVDALFGNQLFGNAIGARVLGDKANFRITTATTKPDVIDYTASLDTIVSDFNNAWPEAEVLRTNLVPNPKPLLGSGGVEYRRNYMLDPVPGSYNFANGTGGASSASTITGATDGPLSGVTKYLRRTITTAKSSGYYGWYDYTSAPGPVAIGEKWTVSVYVRSSVACTMHLDVSGRTGGTAQGTIAAGVATAVPAGEWVRLSTTLTATAVADGIGWWARTEDDLPVSATIDVTAVLVEKTDQVRPYFDGDLSPDPLLVPSWTGTPGTSASVLTAQTPSGWPVSGGETAVLVTDDDGEPCVELIDPVGAGGGYIFALANAAAPGVGRWVAFGVDVKPLTTDQALRMRLRVRTQSGSTTVDQQDSPTGAGWTAGQWTRQVVSVQQTATADNIDAFVWPNGTPIPGPQFRARRAVVAVADTQEEAEAAVASYFDGDTPDTSSLTYSWSGTPNSSPSVEKTGDLISNFNMQFAGYTCKDFSIEPLRRD